MASLHRLDSEKLSYFQPNPQPKMLASLMKELTLHRDLPLAFNGDFPHKIIPSLAHFFAFCATEAGIYARELRPISWRALNGDNNSETAIRPIAGWIRLREIGRGGSFHQAERQVEVLQNHAGFLPSCSCFPAPLPGFLTVFLKKLSPADPLAAPMISAVIAPATSEVLIGSL